MTSSRTAPSTRSVLPSRPSPLLRPLVTALVVLAAIATVATAFTLALAGGGPAAASTRIYLEPPLQSEVAELAPWSLAGYTVTPLASYDLTAFVLSRRAYDQGREADTSPLDFALGWGAMSDHEILAAYRVTQRDRWYYVRWSDSPLPREEVIRSSANTHLLPATPELAVQLEAVQPGEVVRLQGYLVEVRAEDGWRWRSSLERGDTGNGSCEVLWVEAVEVGSTVEAAAR